MTRTEPVGGCGGEPAAVAFWGVSKAFGAVPVLRDFDLDIPAGQRLVILGGSGSGKTTLLRMVGGLEQADAGTISIFGKALPRRPQGALVPRDPPGAREIRRNIGMVFQSFNLFPHMTALENVIEAPVTVMGVQRAQAVEEARAALAGIGLLDLADAYPAEMSGGQQQRVAIVRALTLKPRIMLFDEVTASLDPEKVNEVLKLMLRLAASTSMTMVIVTHEMGFAREVGDRVIFMDKGSIVEDAPPAAFFGAPGHARTRAFLSMVSG